MIQSSHSHTLNAWISCKCSHQNSVLNLKNQTNKRKMYRAVYLRLTQLLLPEELEEPSANHYLCRQPDPKPGVPQLRCALREIWEHGPRTQTIWSHGSCEHRHARAEDLCADQGGGNVDSSERLKKNHAKSDTLKCIEEA